MSVDAIHLNLLPNTPAKKVAISVFVISLVALGIILATAHYYNYNVLYACSPGGLGAGTLIVYILLSHENKKNNATVADTVIPREHLSTTISNNAGTKKIAQPTVTEPIVNITNVNLSLPKNLVFSETNTITVTPDEDVGSSSQRGNKSLGVEEFDAWLQKKPIEGVEVPLSKVIPHEKNKKFLDKMDPEIFNIWGELAKQFEIFQKTHDAREWTQFLDSESVCKSLECVRQKIKETFESVANDPSKNGFFRLRPWLKTIRDKKSYLMVRSSGKTEDSKECANAGKNLSLNYVRPEISSVLIATGQVLASYSEVAPLKNWIEAGKNPFSNDLCLEVLLHELIGEEVILNESIEKKKSEIPISGVLFTSEPDYSEQGFLVTKISATPGHGDGVVNQADVATDTVYVVPSALKKTDYVEVYKKKSKSVRLAPVQVGDKVELQLVNNSFKLNYKRALKPKMVERLVKLAKDYESYKGYPMDIEFVIKGETIYIVQARPVVRVEQKPSYLCPQKVANATANAVVERHTCKVLVPGTSSVIVLRSPEELLVANRLKDADEGLFKRRLHKVVIVGLEEPEDSHPIANFSGKGITCLYATNLAHFHALRDSINDQQVLLICSQSGSVTLWDSRRAPFENCVETGYFTHPADLRISLEAPPQRPLHLHAKSPPQAVVESLSRLKTASTARVAFNILVLELKENAFVTSAQKAYTKLRRKVGDYSGAVADILQIFQQLQKKIEETVSELEANLNNNAPHLATLFHIKTLTSLLSNTNMDIEGAYSLLHVEPLNARANRIAEYREQSPFYPPLDHLVPLEEYALDDEGRKNWFDFLIALEMASKSGELSEKDRKSFSQVLDKYENINILPLWFNFFLLPALKKQTPLQICLSTAQQLPAFSQPFFKQIERQRKSLDQLASNLQSFGDVTAFPNSWKRLEEIGIFLSSDEFIEIYRKADPCQQFIYFQLMKDYTTVNDLAIKAMKGNSKVLAEERVKKFALMVPANDKVLRAWLYKLIGEKNLKLWEDWPLDKYFHHIVYEAWTKCKMSTDSKQLESSPGFNGLAMSLASSIQYDRELKPQTWEDLFTLTHQNQLYALSILMKQLYSKESASFSSLLHAAEECISTIDLRPYIVRLFGLDFSMKEIKLHYNMILRNHSAMIHLIYKPTEPGVIVKVEMYGESRGRFITLLKWLKALDHASLLNLIEEPIHTQKELSFSWKVSNQDQLNWVQQDLTGMIEYTLERLQHEVLAQFVDQVLTNRKNYAHKIGEYFFSNLSFWIWNAPELIFVFLNSPEGESAFSKFAVVHYDRQSINQQLQALGILIDGLPNLTSKEDYDAGVKLLIWSMSLINSYIKQKVEILSCAQLLRRFKRENLDLEGIEKIEKELNTLIEKNDLPSCERSDMGAIKQCLKSMQDIKPRAKKQSSISGNYSGQPICYANVPT